MSEQSTAEIATNLVAMPWLEMSLAITQCNEPKTLAYAIEAELKGLARFYVLERLYGKLAILMRENDLDSLAKGSTPQWITSLL
jgi:hypothetical protein